MRLESIRLVNYACFRDITVKFSSGFNVIAGINGSGKTSLLNAICEYYRLTPDLKNARIEIQSHGGRYRFERRYPIFVEATVKLANGEIFSDTIIKDDSYSPPPEGDYRRVFGGQNEQDEEAVMPLRVFYDAGRSWTGGERKRNETQIIQEKTSRLDAYKDWRSAARDADALKNWVIVKTMERLQTFAETGRSPNDTDNTGDELALVNEAISSAVKEAKGLRYDIKQRSLLMEWKSADGESFKTVLFDSLSDGERVVVALVADIARRACTLNPQLGNDVLKRTPGIVMIDELDLHLHPQWQRRLPNGLKEAFPEMQFIATTHSPQVLSELATEEIILLRGESTEHPEVSYGLNSDRVLEDIMETPARPEKIKDLLSKLFDAIEEGLIEEAKGYVEELSVEAPDITENTRARALIRRKESVKRLLTAKEPPDAEPDFQRAKTEMVP